LIAIGIRYLTGYAVAQDLTRQQAEWPPHPARFFMAMVAAHYATGEDPKERAALEWLEQQTPPGIKVSDADFRYGHESYVPTNDSTQGVNRVRQLRSFAAARPHEDKLFFVWQEEPPSEVIRALGSLCSKVTRVGHSSSLVQAWVAREAPAATLVPDDHAADERLRVMGAGTLRYLDECLQGQAQSEYWALRDQVEWAQGAELRSLKKQLKARFPNEAPQWQRPRISNWQRYRRVKEAACDSDPTRSPFGDDFLVLRKVEGPNLGLESTLGLTGALRDAVLAAVDDSKRADIPEWLSGHQADRLPSRRPHVACFPLAYVGAPHADGHVMGLGLAVPRDCGESRDRDAEIKRLRPLLFEDDDTPRTFELWRKLRGRTLWEWRIQREVDGASGSMTLRRETWIGPSQEWASVTPVVLHHYPNRAKTGDIERIVRAAFRSALLPEPAELSIGSQSAHRGAGHVRSMPEYDEGGADLCRYQVHVTARFPKKVLGPVLVGRGRYRGYGLFRPLSFLRED
jgi:CRISPR-associated protein Csb2